MMMTMVLCARMCAVSVAGERVMRCDYLRTSLVPSGACTHANMQLLLIIMGLV